MGLDFLSSWHAGLLLADALMAGVILSVQLVVYPAFQYFSTEALERWHPVYTRNITALVAPLMVAQLLGGIYWIVTQPGVFPFLYTLFISVLWSFTFLSFVPLHGQIGRGTADTAIFKRLVRLNGVRTLLWLMALTVHLIAFPNLTP